MKINEVLGRALVKHSMTNSVKPSAVYLGIKEHAALHIEMSRLPKVTQQVASYPSRPTWNGMLVYRVDDEHHVAFV